MDKMKERVMELFLEGVDCIDDATGELINLYGLVTFDSETRPLSGVIYGKKAQSLNALYVGENDGLLHISEMSVGGEFIGIGPDMTKSIKAYNDNVVFGGVKISKITLRNAEEICAPQ